MKKQTSRTRRQLLNNTIKYYNSNNRAETTTGVCTYISNDGKMCAIGREVGERKASYLKNQLFGAGVYDDDVFKALPKRLQDMGTYFLQDIQDLHDRKENWNKNGLSEKGAKQVEYIRIIYRIKP